MRPGDLVLLHDPQTAGLVEPLRRHGVRVVWRCHVGADTPNDIVFRAWSFLMPHVEDADRLVFSRAAFIWEGLDCSRVIVIPPSVDAFTPKNEPMPPAAVESILRAAGIHGERPNGAASFMRLDGSPGRVERRIERNGWPPLPGSAPAVVQVSRWDRLKDPAGVLQAFADGIAPSTDAHLVLAGPSTAAVADDPEGPEVLCPGEHHAGPTTRADTSVLAADGRPAGERRDRQRASAACRRDRSEEHRQGFGLTVAEAMWEARPVVASAVGGIQDQIVNGESGILVQADDLDGFAGAVTGLLQDPARAEWMGHNAHERVRGAFLGARHLEQYVDLFEDVLDR